MINPQKKSNKIAFGLVMLIYLSSAFYFLAFGQDEDYFYINASFDPNNAIGLIDNPRTDEEICGLDYDLEAGLRYEFLALYGFYGAFQEIDYQNFGIGVDFYLAKLNNFEGSLGLNHGVIGRKGEFDTWGWSLAFALRGIVTWWFMEDLGLTLRAQGQQRPDITPFAIFEGSAGITYKIDFR